MSDDSTARSVGNAPGHVSRDAYSRSRWMRYFSALGVVILIVIAVFVAPASLNAYDAARHAWISCDVKSAHAGTGSNVNRIGIGGSRAEVEIQTKDCGSLLLRQGVTQANSKQVATRLEEAGRVKLEVGTGSYALRSFLGVINRLPTVYRFRSA
ncbi:hypothetical protein [Curtobacterium sp. 18060]|uniref:hypothetical protein n=1 Tax=Curtobacterium sp. 18060 TaxID=2681408 RepID=UPI00135C52D8|nr:hypothetical protein [Curtobacterium sp. 18060]